MKNSIILKPSKLKGNIKAISSKSFAHRALIMAALSDSPSKIYINEFSKDILVTIDALKNLGVDIKKNNSYVEIIPQSKKLDYTIIDMYESGSSLRFFTAVASHFSKKTKIIGKERLAQRPNLELIDNLRKNGLVIDNDKIPFTISGKFLGGDFKFNGNESSQYITAILLASTRADKTKIELINTPESIGYIDMTIDVLKDFNVDVKKEKYSYIVENPKIISPKKYIVEGDWSNAAFYYAANLMGADISISNLNNKSLQKDKEIVDIIEKIKNSKKNKDTLEIDISQIPDLAPITAVILTILDKTSYIINGKRLRLKESDRLISTAKMINDLGAKAEISGDNLKISGKIKGGIIDCFNDHRIVMAASMAANLASEDIIIKNYKAVNKSYPSFFDDLKSLGQIMQMGD